MNGLPPDDPREVPGTPESDCLFGILLAEPPLNDQVGVFKGIFPRPVISGPKGYDGCLLLSRRGTNVQVFQGTGVNYFSVIVCTGHAHSLIGYFLVSSNQWYIFVFIFTTFGFLTKGRRRHLKQAYHFGKI